MRRIVVVDDEQSIREYLEVLLSRAGYEVELAAKVGEFKAVLARGVDLVVSDMKIGHESGLDVLRLARAATPPPEVILITAYGTPSSAVEAMRQGAYDYIAKPFDNDELLLLVQKALEKRALLEENQQIRDSLAQQAGAAVVGQSPAMRAVWALVDKVAPARSTVLITGESGTGKEVIARAIHQRSPRAARPFLAVNCAAIAEGLLESELFGHEKGSFTGASASHTGILVSAGEGTVLLDEVGELPPSIQVKLLRVLQERSVKPVGSSREVPFEARILAATNKRLEDEVKAGRFREDLFFRLNVIHLELPPLRARPEDIGPLAEFFLAPLRRELGRPGLQLLPETLELLKGFRWSGNVRQLQNVIARAATLADDDRLGPDSLPPGLRGEAESESGVPVTLVPGFSLEHTLDAMERRYLREALRRAGGVKMRAAELLGLTFRSFRYRAAKHGLGDPDAD